MTSEGHNPLNHNPAIPASVLLTSSWTTAASQSMHTRPHFPFPNWRLTLLVETRRKQRAVTSERQDAADVDHSSHFLLWPDLVEQGFRSLKPPHGHQEQTHCVPLPRQHEARKQWSPRKPVWDQPKVPLPFLRPCMIMLLEMAKFYSCFWGLIQPSPGWSSSSSNS